MADFATWYHEPPAVSDLYPGCLTFPVLAEPKIDDLRAVAHIDGIGRVSIRSRSGLVWSCPRIAAEISELLRGWRDMVLDGGITGASWGAAVSGLERGDDAGLRFSVWGILTESEWIGETRPAHLHLVIERMKQMLPRDGQRVCLHSRFGLVCNDQTDVDRAFEVFRASGYEGAVYKQLDAAYGEGWFRRKEYKTIDAPIVAVEEGHGRLAGTCGAVVVDAAGVAVRVGIGLSDEMRRRLWKLGDHARGQVVEFRQEAAPASGRAAPAVFVRMRPDKIREPVSIGESRNPGI